jgi:hypothetical protein
MDIPKMLAHLRNELGEIERAIIVLERLATGQRKRPGRPPKWMSQGKDEPPSLKDAPRKRQSDAVKRNSGARRKRPPTAKNGE